MPPSSSTAKLTCSLPNEEAITQLVGVILLEANDDWQLQHRYMQIEGMAELNAPHADDPLTQFTPEAA